MKRSRKNILKFSALILLLVALGFTTWYYSLGELLSVERVRGLVGSYSLLAPLVFMGIYIFATLFFLPGSPLTLAAGAVFGIWAGTLYTVIGATLGASLAFFLSRFLGRDFVEGILEDKTERIYQYNEKLGENGFVWMLFFRLVPLFPFNGLNFGLGLTKVKARDYILGTAIGIIPGSFAYSYFGDSVATLDTWNIVASALLLVALISLPLLYKKYGGGIGGKEDEEEA